MKMSQVFLLLVCLGVGLGLCGCPGDETLAGGNGSVQFGLEQLSEAAAARGIDMATALLEASAVLVSVEDAAHNPVLSLEVLPLFNMGGFPITHPVPLASGTYYLTEFVVLDSSSAAYLACPLEGSALAPYVSDPLPIEMNITTDVVTQVVPEVIYSEVCAPQDFGYATFSFEIVNIFDFYLAVFTYDGALHNYTLTDSNLTIYGDGVEIFDNPLPAATNAIILTEGYSTYHLVVEKFGFTPWEATYTLEELNLDCADLCPLVAVLEEAGGVVTLPPTETPSPTPEVSTPPPVIDEGTFFLVPDETTVTAGTAFDLEIHLNSEVERLGVYQIRLGYDPAVIMPLDTSPTNFCFDVGADGFITAVNSADSASGSVGVNGMQFPVGTGPGADLHILTAHFTALTAGTSAVTILVDQLASDLGVAIAGADSLSGQVTVLP